MRIDFIAVGRNKLNWTAELEPIDTEIIRHLHKRKVFASKLIDIDMDSGAIFAGMRQVGRFELQPFQPKAPHDQ